MSDLYATNEDESIRVRTSYATGEDMNRVPDAISIVIGNPFFDDAAFVNLDLFRDDAVAWYKTLSANQRINLRELSRIIVGLSWEKIKEVFTWVEAITMLYLKLKKEGFKV